MTLKNSRRSLQAIALPESSRQFFHQYATHYSNSLYISRVFGNLGIRHCLAIRIYEHLDICSCCNP
ncbi:MAG: hypothetical protein V7K25_09670 [Nostoc sp.]|uniref:hypothetical protein n=1 Tax=Nostoc sp. TaxID=1180 RepID=UPI002FF8A0FB